MNELGNRPQSLLFRQSPGQIYAVDEPYTQAIVEFPAKRCFSSLIFSNSLVINFLIDIAACEWVRYRQLVGAGLADNLCFLDQNNGKTRPYQRAISEQISVYLTRLQAAVSFLFNGQNIVLTFDEFR